MKQANGFPLEYQNANVVVINPSTKKVWSRSLDDAKPVLNDSTIASLKDTIIFRLVLFDGKIILIMDGKVGFDKA